MTAAQQEGKILISHLKWSGFLSHKMSEKTVFNFFISQCVSAYEMLS